LSVEAPDDRGVSSKSHEEEPKSMPAEETSSLWSTGRAERLTITLLPPVAERGERCKGPSPVCRSAATLRSSERWDGS